MKSVFLLPTLGVQCPTQVFFLSYYVTFSPSRSVRCETNKPPVYDYSRLTILFLRNSATSS